MVLSQRQHAAAAQGKTLNGWTVIKLADMVRLSGEPVGVNPEKAVMQGSCICGFVSAHQSLPHCGFTGFEVGQERVVFVISVFVCR